MKLITARIFDNPIDAHLLKTKLESEGIECYLYDENTVTLNPIYNTAVGGIKLKILESDTEKVQKLLYEIEGKPYLKENDEIVKCPNCNSSNLYSGYRSMKGVRSIFAAIFSFLSLTVPIYFKRVYKCKECEKEFKSK